MSLPTPFDPRLGTLLNQVGLSDNPVEAMNSLAFIRGTISRIQSIGLQIGRDGDSYLCVTTTDPCYISMSWHGRQLGWIAEVRNPKDPTEPPMTPIAVDFLKTHLITHFS